MSTSSSSPKIYTKRGDAGETSLASGTVVSKSDSRLHAYGTIDELNSHLGSILALLREGSWPDQCQELITIQRELFTVGTRLATDNPNQLGTFQIRDTMVQRLENQIDRYSQELSPLKNFLLPGGSQIASMVHVARTVCRRAERWIEQCHHQHPVTAEIRSYMNRLSDYLFVLARFVNKRLNQPEELWQGRHDP